MFNRLSHNTLVGMTGVVDYTNYDDMKYSASEYQTFEQEDTTAWVFFFFFFLVLKQSNLVCSADQEIG